MPRWDKGLLGWDKAGKSLVRSADTVTVSGEHWERMMGENARLSAEVERCTAIPRPRSAAAYEDVIKVLRAEVEANQKLATSVARLLRASDIALREIMDERDACKAELHDLAVALEEVTGLYDQNCEIVRDRTPAYDFVQAMVAKAADRSCDDCRQYDTCNSFLADCDATAEAYCAWLAKGKEGKA